MMNKTTRSQYSMGAPALNKPCSLSLKRQEEILYDTLEEAVEAVSLHVAKTGESRYVMKTVIFVEPAPPHPAVVTVLDQE